MFKDILSCKISELNGIIEEYYYSLETKEEAELLIRTIWKRVPELNVQQEKEIHKLGRLIRKKFNMKPVKIEEE